MKFFGMTAYSSGVIKNSQLKTVKRLILHLTQLSEIHFQQMSSIDSYKVYAAILAV